MGEDIGGHSQNGRTPPRRSFLMGMLPKGCPSGGGGSSESGEQSDKGVKEKNFSVDVGWLSPASPASPVLAQ